MRQLIRMATWLAMAAALLAADDCFGQTTYAQQLGDMGAKLDDAISAKDAQIATMSGALHDLVPPSTELSSLWPASDSILRGTTGAAYALHQTGSAVIRAGGFAGAGNTIALTPAPGGSSGIILQGAAAPIAFSGATLTGPVVPFRIYGDPKSKTAAGFLLRDLIFDRSLGSGPNLDAWSDNVKIQDCHFGTIGGDGVYVTSDNFELTDSDFAGSQGEHDVRFDLNGSTAHRPANASIANCRFANHNPQGKETIAVRECDGLTVSNCTFDGWVGLGQSDKGSDWHARRVVFIDCKWLSLRPGGALVQVEHDVDVEFIRCAFPGSDTDSDISANARSTVTLRNCILYTTGAVAKKPIASANGAAVITGIETTLLVNNAPAMPPVTNP